MPLPRLHISHKRWITRICLSIALISMIIAGVAVQQLLMRSQPPTASLPATQSLLPRQEVWKNNVSSFMFGTNDTYEWSDNNIQSSPIIQKLLRDAGFTMVRSFFPNNAKDDVIEKRIKTIETIRASCLGVITDIFNTAFNKHLIEYLGNRCNIYEFGNEPDLDNIPVNTYLKQWNTVVPQLRKINPNANFIGPVTYFNLGAANYMQNFLTGVQKSKVYPDAVSYHSYPCWKETEQQCAPKAVEIGKSAIPVREMIKRILGQDLPIAITEWNYDAGNPPPAYGDKSDFMTKFSTEAIKSMITNQVAIACQFDAASYSGYGRLDMINVENNQPKAQFLALKKLIATYRPY